MSDKINLTSMIATLSKTVDFNEFYHIGIEPHRSRISLQGTINSYTIGVAKKLNVEIRPSTVKTKKIDVYEFGKKIASIGDTAYGDYGTFLKTKGKKYAEMRRLLYHTRHTKQTPVELLSKYILW